MSVELDQVQAKLEKIRLLEEKNRLRVGLPHLHGWKWYPWARQFYESTNKINLLVAGNQLSKSSTQIRKCIDWATDTSKWEYLWRSQPRQFWYLYPAANVSTIEVKKKWIPEFMPAGEFQKDPQYGWEAEWDSKKIHAIHFNTGVSVYFKHYSQDTQNLQTGTVHAIFCDEELPVEHYEELMFRLEASDGYFNMVFTATLGQPYWYQAMERRGKPDEVLKDALKLQVSAYDCLKYEDGSPTPWSVEKIRRAEARCRSRAEALKRVYGRFIKDEGLKYPGYSHERNFKGGGPIPQDWTIFAGVDVGSGGAHAHPAAIVFIAVDPQFRRARVVKAWRGDGIQTAASDVLMQYLHMKAELGRPIARAFYDWASAEFSIMAGRVSEPFEKADKSHDSGEQTLNALFKNSMLFLDAGDTEIEKLDIELCTVTLEMDKRKAKDDLSDGLRYAVNKLPWDWTAITANPDVEPVDPIMTLPLGGLDLMRREGKLPAHLDPRIDYTSAIEQEFEEINALYDY